jgi:hypothetical protein
MKHALPSLITSRLCWLLLALFTPLLAGATHIVGGELDLQYRTDNIYTLSLNLYFDAVNGSAGALDQQITASIFSKADNRRLTNVVLTLTSNTFVNYTSRPAPWAR